LGILHPDYLLEQLTAKQLIEWEAFNLLEPIGEHRGDWKFGMLASIMTNLTLSIHKKKGSNPKLTSPEDFIPIWSGRKKEKEEVYKQSTQEMKDLLLGFTKRHNDRLKKQRTTSPVKRRK